MITAADAALHRPDPEVPRWAETNFFGFHEPESGTNGHVYCLFRPNLGVCLTTVAINSRHCTSTWDAEYVDMSVHVPMGDNFDLQNYSVASGVSVRCLEPVMAYQVDYDDGEGNGVHFEFRGLTPGYDIHDPDLDPMVAAGSEASKYAWGTAYNGHYDQTGVCQGEIVLRGRTLPFRCVATRDHSWGPRNERHPTTLSWLNAAFGENFAVHAMCDFDPYAGGTDIRFTHGYVIEDGKLTGLSGGRAKTRRERFFPKDVTLEVADPAGREWTFHGEALTGFPWPAWPDVVGFNALMRWHHDGRTGYGEAYDFYGLQTLNELSTSR